VEQQLARRFWRRRVVLLAVIIVALSIGIVIAGVPYITHPPGTLQQSETHDVPGGSPDHPGVYPITLQGISAGAQFAIGVTVTGGEATFCVIQFASYLNWAFNNQTEQFPYNNCILNQQTAQGTLRFTPTVTGSWNVVAINTDPQPITVEFSPAA
jgi:hypothetical protein